MVYNFGSALLRAKGDTKRPMYYLMFSGIVNVILNLFFVIVFKLDVAGVALATVISQCISAFLVVRCLTKETEEFRLELKKLAIDQPILYRIIKIGVPAGLQGIVFSLSNVVIQSAINSFGSTVIAGNSAALNIEGFVYTSMNGFSQGTLTFVSQNLGAAKHNRIKRSVLISLGCVFVIGIVLGFAIAFFGYSLLGIYTSSLDVIAVGIKRLWIIGITYALCGMMDVCANALRGMGKSMQPMIITLLGACGIRLLWLATIFRIPKFHSPEIIYISYPVSWGITLGALLIAFIVVAKKESN
ncbi:MAG: polysaccharide biosynthesis C-terminal domain-containing protein [Spirochaetaceae bacterium]|nr:polysaccharide biosynthesis C-terminal domain-containing protein [Spirochaetaceae bacterium]